MPARKGLLAPQNTFLDTIATRFDGTHSNFVLGNAKIALKPIVYCSDGFCELTGYSRAQIMQKSCACNFLYGPKTDVQHREAITNALSEKQELKLELILYKSSRTPFWCLLDIVPIQDEKHEVVLFLCSHKDITKQKLHQEKELELQRLLEKQQRENEEAAPQVAGSEQHLDIGTNSTNSGLLVEPDQQARLSALASHNALINMDEFQLDGSANSSDQDEQDQDEEHDKQTASLYSRRRSRAVLYQLSGHYGYRRNVNMKSKLKLNNRMNIPEYKTTTIEKQRFLLSHYGLGKSCWDWLILAVSFYVAIVVPYNATFNDKQQDNANGERKIDTIDILVELVFIVDVILNFRTTFVNRKGEVVTLPKSICRHYIRGWFVVDACAALPFDLLGSLNLYSRSRLDLNLVKLIRLLRLARLLQKMDRYSQYSYIILTLLMLIFSLLAHWCACIWYVIAKQEIAEHPPEWRIGWINQLSEKLGYSVLNASDTASSYVTALYFTTSSLTSVGFGNVSANTNYEKVFSIVIMLIGALMHAVVFGNVTALIRVMYARRSNYQTRLRDLKDFFRLHQLPKELQQRMSDYFQTTWSLNHGIETYEILKDFPEELRGDVSLHLHREVLSLPIFETAPQGFLKSLARHIESKFCCPTEYLIHRRDALNYLYLVCNGSMEVLQDNMVVAILGKGDLVGYDVNAVPTPEHTIYANLSGKAGPLATAHGLVKSSSDLKALTYCDLKCIHISGLLETLKLYPEFSDTFHREIVHDLSFNLRENPEEQVEGEETDEEEDDDDDEDDDEEEEEEDEEDEEDNDKNSSSPGDRNHDNDDDDDDDDDDNSSPGGFSSVNRSSNRHSPPPNIGHLYKATAIESGARTASSEQQVAGRFEPDKDGKQNNKGAKCDHNIDSDDEEETEQTDFEDNMPDLRDTSELKSGQNLENKLRRRKRRNGKPVEGLDSPTSQAQPSNGSASSCLSELVTPFKSKISQQSLADANRTSSLSCERLILDSSASTRPPRLRSAIGRAGTSDQHGRGGSKPPLSFDLSRNTTALIDRRRRSAGCISRPLLIGAGGLTGRRVIGSGHSSSLIHINEEAAELVAKKTALSTTTTTAKTKISQQQTVLVTNRAPQVSAGLKSQQVEAATFLTHEGLKGIDARITGISTSIRELKQELRVELNQFHSTIQLLMQLLQQNWDSSSISAVNCQQKKLSSFAGSYRHHQHHSHPHHAVSVAKTGGSEPPDEPEWHIVGIGSEGEREQQLSRSKSSSCLLLATSSRGCSRILKARGLEAPDLKRLTSLDGHDLTNSTGSSGSAGSIHSRVSACGTAAGGGRSKRSFRAKHKLQQIGLSSGTANEGPEGRLSGVQVKSIKSGQVIAASSDSAINNTQIAEFHLFPHIQTRTQTQTSAQVQVQAQTSAQHFQSQSQSQSQTHTKTHPLPQMRPQAQAQAQAQSSGSALNSVRRFGSQATNLNNSDYELLQSSSSVSSSPLQLATGHFHPYPSQRNPSPQSPTTSTPLKLFRAGRPAKVLVNSALRYTIDIKDENENENENKNEHQDEPDACQGNRSRNENVDRSKEK